MSSEENVDLTVVADAAVHKETGNIVCISEHFEGPEIEAFENEDAELRKAVWKTDAEEAIKNARTSERQKILIRYEDILEEELNEHGFKRKSYRQALERLIDEIADKTEELRDELEEEVTQS